MQILHSILQIGSGGCRLTDEFGSESGVKLELMLGTAARLEFDLRGETELEDVQLPVFPVDDIGDCANYFALDTQNSNSNDPALLRYSGITVASDGSGHNIFAVELDDNATAGIIKSIANRTSADFRAEIGGVDANGRTVFAWQFDLTIRSRVFLGEASETVINDPAYYTAVQTLAMLNDRAVKIAETLSNELEDKLNNPVELQFSVDGISNWHENQTTDDKYYRQRIANINAEWSAAVMMAPGQKGEPGTNGTDGKDGHTPVRGTDYWTDADKAEIKNYVDEAILNGAW